MSAKSLFLAVMVLASVACNQNGGAFPSFTPGDKVTSNQVLPNPETMDLNTENYLGRVESDAGNSSQERDEWNSTRERANDAFNNELGDFPEFGVLNQILENAAQIDLTVGDDGILRADFQVQFEFLGNPIVFDVEMSIFPNVQTGFIETTLVLNGIKRLFVTHDLQITQVNTTIFNADEEPAAEVTFRREDQDFGIRFVNLNNNNEIVVTADRDALFLERDKDSDGFGNSNFEVQVLVETNEFFGQAVATVPFLGAIDFCFGNRRLEDLGCNEIEPILPEVPGFPE
jgi:hypothetical protein